MKSLFILIALFMSFASMAVEVQDKPIEAITTDRGTCGHYDRIRIAVIEKRLEATKSALVSLGCTVPESKAVLKQLERDGVLFFRCGEWQVIISEKSAK